MAGSYRGQRGKQSLKDEVRDALLAIVRYKEAPAPARALSLKFLPT
jgi:hypothetical protein